jgi:hypothetical protein
MMMIFNPLWLFFILFQFQLFNIDIESPQFSYLVQHGTPTAIQNFVDPLSGCNWTGVAGQVFDDMGRPVNGYIVEVNGVLGGNFVNAIAITGNSLQIGPGGYEINLADQPIRSVADVYMELFDPAGEALSGRVYFNTYDECEHNLVIINMIEFNPVIDIYFPIVSSS